MIIIARNYGQLGNRLFLYGQFLAAAREYSVELANPSFAEYAHLFPSTESDLWCRYPVSTKPPTANPKTWQRRSLAKAVYLGTKTLSLAGLRQYPFHVIRIRGEESFDLGGEEFASAVRSGRHILASGWLFRSQHLFQKHAAVVRHHFRLPDNNRAAVDRLMRDLRQDSDVVIGIHIRHGDYATFMDGRYYYSLDQYAALMHRVVEQLSGQRVKFLVCSNANWIPEIFDGLDVTPGTGHITEDMYALAETDLIFGPPSTYTGWAAFYGEKPLLFMENADPDFDANQLLQQRIPSAA